MGVSMNLLFKLLLRAGVSGPAFTLDLDLTSSLDSRITFTRAGTRNRISGGVVTSLATGLPAFESWGGVNRGMAIEPAFSNLLTYSNDFSNGVWWKNSLTRTTGDTGPDGSTAMTLLTEQAVTDVFETDVQVAYSGPVQTLSVFVKPKSGSTRWSFSIRASNANNNAGGSAYFMFDGTQGHITFSDAGILTGTVGGIDTMANGIYRVWLSGTWVTLSGNKGYEFRSVDNTTPLTRAIAGNTSQGFQVWGAQVSDTARPCGYVATSGSAQSQAAETAIFNDTAWLTTAQGTFLIEHDCYSGVLIGSGANTILSATTPGKTAIAWSGVTSDTVNNGGATTTGIQPTFSGSAVRLLSTTGASNSGHIKSIRFYPTRLTVAQMQVLTARSVVSTATPNVLRGVSVNNRLPSTTTTTSGTSINFISRFKLQLGGSDVSELRLDFPNITFAGVATGNSLILDEVALERETGVVETRPVYFSGGRTKTVLSGAATTALSDTILPSAFTGLSVFPANTVFWVRIKGRVTTAGHVIPGCRYGYETNSYAKIYDPAAVTFSSTDGTGIFTITGGSDPGTATWAYAPILVGKFVAGDPKTCMVVGDSIIEGTGGVEQSGNFVRLAAINTGTPLIEMSQGGSSQNDLVTNTGWYPYLAYSRVLFDEMGTNASSSILAHFKYWQTAKTTYGLDNVVRLNLTPRCAPSGDFSSEGVQTVNRAYPSDYPDGWGSEVVRYGYVPLTFTSTSIRGTDQAKWKTNGVAYKYTGDGLHPTADGNELIRTDFQPVLAALTVS